MKFTQTFFILLGTLFFFDFVNAIFYNKPTHELFIWEVDVTIYRIYRFTIAAIFLGKGIYDYQKNKIEINSNN